MKPQSLDFEKMQAVLGCKLIANGRQTQALHDTVVALQANRRAGTHSTLTKATVNLSGSKPWRQKGTGRARAGYASSPIWRGGGVVFGPHPRDYSKKISKKTKRVALRKAVSELAKSGRAFSVSSIQLSKPKTRELAQWIKSAGLDSSLLILTSAVNENLLLASRNLPRVCVFQAQDANAEDILRYKQVLILEDALPILAGRIAALSEEGAEKELKRVSKK